MPVEGAAELAALFDAAEFGVDATWTAAGGPVTVTGLFLDQHAVVAELDALGVSSSTPVFVCPSSAVPAGAARNDSLEISGVTYRVAELRPSGDGVTRTALEEA